MTLRPALARLERGFRRMGGWAVRTVTRRPVATVGHIEQARETEVSLGLMADASAAVEPTPEQQIFLSQAEHGMRERLSVLLGIPHRSLAQEREKLAIEGWLTPAPIAPPSRIRRFLPALPVAAGLAVRPWMLWTAALAAVALWGGYNDVRAGRAENERDEALALAEQNERAAIGWRERAEEYRLHLIDAAEVARVAAETLESERQRAARAAARERRRQREVQDVLTGSPDAPDWSLRDDGATDRDSGTAR